MSEEKPGMPASPLSHKVNAERLTTTGKVIELRPDADTRAALADFNDIVAIEDMAAELTVKRWHRDGVRVTGHVVADLVQSCAVTLEPVSQHLETDIDALFVPEGSKLARQALEGTAGEIVIDPDGADMPEPFEPPWLDVGHVVQEFFALAIDPFPRAPGVSDEPVRESTAGEDEPAEPGRRPFEDLAALRDKLKSKG